MSVKLYTINSCVFCDMSKSYLLRKKIPHDVIILEPGEERNTLMEKTGCKTFPQVFVQDKFIGGYEELKNLRLDEATEHRVKEISGVVEEDMCNENMEFDRFILFNGKSEFQYADVWDLYKKELSVFWTVEEIDLNEDVLDWKSSSDDERHFVKMILAFFASLDQIVMENVTVNFGEEIVIPQIRSHFTIQNAIESIHGETYALLIQTYIKEPEEQKRVLRSIQTMPIIGKKAGWVTKWMNASTCSLAERLVAFTCVEGIQFSGAFCAIYWLKKQGRFKGLCFANSLIARDEGLHAEGSVMIYKHLIHKLPQNRVHQIFQEAVDVEKEFIRDALPVSLIGMNSGTMSTYIEYVADFWLQRLGYDNIYNSKNPFEWMQLIGMQGKTNFFEGRVTEYSKAGSFASSMDQAFTLEADF